MDRIILANDIKQLRISVIQSIIVFLKFCQNDRKKIISQIYKSS